MGGFDCSSHRRRDGRRLDLLASSGHAQFAAQDYRALASLGIRAARDGLSWFQIESRPGRYDWSGFLPMLQAARDARVEIVWDLCHYGWPDDIDIWSADFVDRFARYSSSVADLIVEETGQTPYLCPVQRDLVLGLGGWRRRVHESRYSCSRPGAETAAGARGYRRPSTTVRLDHPEARFLFAEPAIYIDGGTDPVRQQAARNHRHAQFEAMDMISGLRWPELGGSPDHLDIVGLNYYPEISGTMKAAPYRSATMPTGRSRTSCATLTTVTGDP
jgi:hypothetical protein